jgi:hypothetical protein
VGVLPVAHVGHWLWVLYLPPVLIVVGSIGRARLLERRERDRGDEAASLPADEASERRRRR